MNKDRYLSLFYILFGVVVIIVAANIKTMFAVASEDTGPKFFPYIVGVCMCLCGIGKFFSSKDKKAKQFVKSKKDWLRIILISSILLAYAILIKYLGYVICSTALLISLAILLADEKKPKTWKVIVFSVAVVAVVFIMFKYVLKISLPEGIWIKAIRKAIF
ncbi:MAG: tripartite tricarboxylate transporter TctB family protein [Spirochaetales bacterium]|nr:tripartite tricarboxylate transporter TctB family protein [Spirochaetales bacterium]MBO4717879.1 tripartite tricarboxylate transporter TctB family protein [Spirochaetales bacterium]